MWTYHQLLHRPMQATVRSVEGKRRTWFQWMVLCLGVVVGFSSCASLSRPTSADGLGVPGGSADSAQRPSNEPPLQEPSLETPEPGVVAVLPETPAPQAFNTQPKLPEPPGFFPSDPSASSLPRTPFPSQRAQAMRPAAMASVLEQLKDDLPLQPLLDAVRDQVEFLRKSKKHQTLSFGDRTVSKEEYVRGLERFLELGSQAQSKEEFLAQVREEFDFYEVYGPPGGDWSEAEITAYYEPVIEGSRTKTARFSQPLYRRPSDLVHARVQASPSSLCTHKAKAEKKACLLAQRGRYLSRARYVKRKHRWVLAPYFTRNQIDRRGVLRRRHLELCYVDPLDAYFLQIEGSGVVMIDGKEPFPVRVSDQNGYPNRSYTKEILSKSRESGSTAEQWLRSLSLRKLAGYLDQNQSYVFFEENRDGVNTALGMRATAGRTIATDPRYFPKGALAFLVAKKPKFSTEDELIPTEWEPLSRFVLDQDTGGAIRGGGRVDLFWGAGPEAKRYADVIHQEGHLYYLVPKPLVPPIH